jgi:endonuclease-8
MPEGPEIRLAADRIARAIEGKKISCAKFFIDHLAEYDELFTGVSVREIQTKGKALLTHFENGYTIYSHNQLYGRWYVSAGNKMPKTSRSLRLALHTGDHTAWLYSATDVSVWESSRLGEHPFLSRLGPDILDSSLNARDVENRLCSKQFSGRSLGSLYLDQHFLAGIGNYLRSEILFDAGVSPFVRPKSLGQVDIESLSAATVKISRRSYKTKGITNPPKLVEQLKGEGWTRSKYRHAVFGREGGTCHICDSRIAKGAIASRRIYYCEVCQKD